MAEAEPTTGDYSIVVRDSQSAILASAERITVVGRWVVLAAAVILNHFGNRNSQASVLVVDTILFGWGLVNLVVSVVLVRGYKPGRWFGFLTTGIDLLVATSILYFSGGYGAPTDFSAPVVTAASGSTSTIVDGLNPGTKYFFIVRAVDDNALDLALVTMPVRGERLAVTPLLDEPLVAVLPPQTAAPVRLGPHDKGRTSRSTSATRRRWRAA